MFHKFFPHEYVNSTYDIPFERLYNAGFRGIIFDIDNTLVPHGADADEKAKELFLRLKKIGFQTCLLSNNKEPRVVRFNESIQSPYIFKANKPALKGYQNAMEKMHTTVDNTLFVGDQLFTDVWGAKRAGLHCILVKPIHPKEEIQIVLKRKLEKVVLNAYTKQKNIVLIGFMGCGKSTIGKTLAKKLNRPLIDTDTYIEQRDGMTIPEIFAQKGEEYFRKVETQALQELVDNTYNSIIASGGGLPLREVNADLLKKLGKVFFLTATEETVYERVKGSTNRPLLQVEDPKAKIHELLEYRTPLYKKAANEQIITDGRSAKDIADEIVKKL